MAMNEREQRARDAELLRIAQETLFLETLETRKSDALDFKEQAVWSIKEALEAAFLTGMRHRAKDCSRKAAHAILLELGDGDEGHLATVQKIIEKAMCE